MPEILTLEETAKMLRMNPVTVRGYLRDGKLRGRKIGKAWRVLESDVIAFIRGDAGANDEPTTKETDE